MRVRRGTEGACRVQGKRPLRLFTLFVAGLWACGMPGALRAQEGEWRSHTSFREVTAVSSSATHVWLGTTGGVFSYAKEGGETQRYSINEGLSGLRITAVSFDEGCGAEGCVWIGHEDGVLDRLDVQTGEVAGFRDIERASHYSSRRINRLINHGSSLLITTDFGVVVLDKASDEVIDTYDHFSTLDPATRSFDAVVAPGPEDNVTRLWIATERGIAHAPLQGSNLQDPNSWSVDSLGLPSSNVRALAYFDGSLYAGTTSGLALRGIDGTYNVLPGTSGAVTQLTATSSMLVGIDEFDFLALPVGGELTRARLADYDQPVAFAAEDGGAVWFGHNAAGLVPARLNAGDLANVTVLRDCLSAEAMCYPAGPFNNLFVRLDFDAQGNLWAAGAQAGGTGFHRLNREGEWTDFVNLRKPGLGDAYYRIHAAPDGTVWAGSDGNGVVQVGADDGFTRYTRQNSTLRTADASGNEDYIVVGGVASDPDGGIWVTNVRAPHPLHVRAADGEWTGLSFPGGCGGFSSFSASFRDLFIDQYGQKWLRVINYNNLRESLGLLVLDTKNTPADQSDDDCRVFRDLPSRNQQGLPSDSVYTVVEDRDGLLWVATEEGIAYTVNTGVVAADENATFSWPLFADPEEGTFVLQGLRVSDLAVDPANRLWAATTDGLWLVGRREEGFEVLEHFTRENSPLPSDNVLAVAVSPVTGEVFAATDAGLVSYQGDAIQASETAGDLLVFPNPVTVSDGREPRVHIQNLVESTEVMIMTVDGTLVNRFAVRGGQGIWDGRDTLGQPAPSGMYLVVAVGRNGEGAAYGKVALIR